MSRKHSYKVDVEWTGNTGSGTRHYREYERAHEIRSAGKPPISGSSDPGFRGDASRWNPEELLVGSVSACHKLWYLHLCSMAGVVVLAYRDAAEGTMVEDADGGGRFESVVLRPEVTVAPDSDLEVARALHTDAHQKCFIANSVNFPVGLEPTVVTPRTPAT